MNWWFPSNRWCFQWEFQVGDEHKHGRYFGTLRARVKRPWLFINQFVKRSTFSRIWRGMRLCWAPAKDVARFVCLCHYYCLSGAGKSIRTDRHSAVAFRATENSDAIQAEPTSHFPSSIRSECWAPHYGHSIDINQPLPADIVAVHHTWRCNSSHEWGRGGAAQRHLAACLRNCFDLLRISPPFLSLAAHYSLESCLSILYYCW